MNAPRSGIRSAPAAASGAAKAARRYNIPPRQSV